MRPLRVPRSLVALVTLLGVHGVLTGAGALGSALGAQEGCQFGEGSGDFQSITLVGGGRITYVGTPHFVCADGVEIWADSAVAYSAQNMSHLIGHVRFLDRVRELRADEARYFSRVGRLQAEGHVFLRDTERGSEIENGRLVYLRQTEFREGEQIDVTTGDDGVRPRAKLFMKPAAADTAAAASDAAAPDSAAVAPDSAAAIAPDTAVAAADTTALPDSVEVAEEEVPDTATGPPYLVEGDHLFLEGDAYFRATGRVSIDRDSLHATADTAEYDQVAARLLLQGHARAETSSFDLEGRRILFALAGGDVREIRALDDAVLTGQDLLLTAPQVRVFMVDGLLDRLVAIPYSEDEETASGEAAPVASAAIQGDSGAVAPRPVARAEDFTLTADSIEVVAPGQALDYILAVGNARGESAARDSLNVETLPPVALHDWLVGDTVRAEFEAGEEPAPGDTTAARYTLKRLVAGGSARSLYRLLPSDSTARPGEDPPAVHYVTGSRITITLDEGEVEGMEVEGPAHGFHLEPLSRRAAVDSLAADSLAADSLAAGDTASGDTAAVGDTLRVTGQGVDGGDGPARSGRGEEGTPVKERPAVKRGFGAALIGKGGRTW